MAQRLIIDIVADPVCPWCFVGIHSFAAARAALAGDFEIVHRYRPYQLNPDTPAEGVDRAAYYEKKFPDPEQRRAGREALIAAAREAGADFDPSTPTRLVNTLKAHCVLRWAHFEGLHEAFAHKLYGAYWLADADIGSTETLAALANTVGLNGANVAEKLERGVDASAVGAEAEAFRAGGVTAAPTFIVDETKGFAGAPPPDQLAETVRRAVGES